MILLLLYKAYKIYETNGRKEEKKKRRKEEKKKSSIDLFLSFLYDTTAIVI